MTVPPDFQAEGTLMNAGRWVKRLMFVVFAIGFGAFGAWQLFKGASDVGEAWASVHWSTTTATVMASAVVRANSYNGHGKTSYRPGVTYTYLVEGKTYVGTMVSPGRVWRRSSAEAVVARFPVGSERAVYFSPENPARVVLLPGLEKSNWAQTVLGLLLVTAAALTGAVAFRKEGAPTGWITHVLGVSVCLEFGAMAWVLMSS